MKYGFIVENFTDFEIEKYYSIVSTKENKILDTFRCTNYDTAAKHYLTYTSRGCEIWKWMDSVEAVYIINELSDKENVYYELFSRSKRSCGANLKRCCELSMAKKRVKEVYNLAICL